MTKKRKYEKPLQRVIELQHRTQLLQASGLTGTRKKDVTYGEATDPWAE